MTKLKCNLCGEVFKAEDFECSNIDGEIVISCPNECVVETICLLDFGDVEEVKETP